MNYCVLIYIEHEWTWLKKAMKTNKNNRIILANTTARIKSCIYDAVHVSNPPSANLLGWSALPHSDLDSECIWGGIRYTNNYICNNVVVCTFSEYHFVVLHLCENVTKRKNKQYVEGILLYLVLCHFNKPNRCEDVWPKMILRKRKNIQTIKHLLWKRWNTHTRDFVWYT